MSLRATDVFVPGSYPQYTYIVRDAEGLEDMLRDSLSTPGHDLPPAFVHVRIRQLSSIPSPV